jgi:thiamine monophosphate synthase
MLNNITKFYIFLDKLDKIIIQNLSKLKNYSIIYNPKNNNFDINNLVKMQTYCKKRGINFYIKDDYKNANKFGAYGICLTSQNKSMGRGKLELKLKKIGIVHNQIEYARKCGQFCTMIMLSPIFITEKYTINRILNILKFNLISKNWTTNLCALGGLKGVNFKKTKMTKAKCIGFEGYIKKAPLSIS